MAEQNARMNRAQQKRKKKERKKKKKKKAGYTYVRTSERREARNTAATG